jgi:N-acetylneuraminate synthase/N,N'-diacetyllegionaminate synthase
MHFSTAFVSIGDRRVGPGNPCFIIAEAGVNHNGSVKLAKRLVDVAAQAGADAVKWQLFRAEEQVSRAAQTAKYQQETTGEQDMLLMGSSYDLAWEAHRDIAAHCRARGIQYMASCFDPEAVDFYLDELGGTAIKVGSGELTNAPLLAYMARRGAPILLSTGMATLEEVAWAVEHIRASGDAPLALFQCVSSYPTEPAASNLRAIETLSSAFGVPVGFSDHTTGHAAACAAVALGSDLIEKHYTVDKTLKGPDHRLSLNPQELTDFVRDLRDVEAALGDGRKRPHPSEEETREVARRSLVSAEVICAGKPLTAQNVTRKRPATGIDPRLWDVAEGRTAVEDIPADVPITWEMLR